MVRQTSILTATKLRKAFTADDSSFRQKAAMAAGIDPDPAYVDVLVEQCAVEPDFFVRDMLTWALTRQDHDLTFERVIGELGSATPQATSQALHTLSKLGDARGWPHITTALLTNEDDEIARTAWRAATGLVPDGERAALAQTLVTQLGRGEREIHRSLSRALVAVGDDARESLTRAAMSTDESVRTHALATEHLLDHPDDGIEFAIAEAERIIALDGAPVADD